VIDECVRVLRPGGSICWQVGNHVTPERSSARRRALSLFKRHDDLVLRNRVVSGLRARPALHEAPLRRYEVLLWFTRAPSRASTSIPSACRRVSRQAGVEAARGRVHRPSAGQEPGDVWTFPNVKANHIGRPRTLSVPHQAGRARAPREHRSRRPGARPVRRCRHDGVRRVLHRRRAAVRRSCRNTSPSHASDRDGGGRHARDRPRTRPCTVPTAPGARAAGRATARATRATRPRSVRAGNADQRTRPVRRRRRATGRPAARGREAG
jgi:hypothetical protein